MGRHYAQINEWEVYVPDVDNERELFEETPDEALTVEVKHLSRKQLNDVLAASERTTKRNGKASKADEKLVEKMFRDNVRSVSNFTIGNESIETGAQLYEQGDPDLIADISKALVDRASLDKGLAKNLQSGSAS